MIFVVYWDRQVCAGSPTSTAFVKKPFCDQESTTECWPLIMEKVSKLARGCRLKRLIGRELRDFDSVKKVSILIDGCQWATRIPPIPTKAKENAVTLQTETNKQRKWLREGGAMGQRGRGRRRKKSN